jgi:DNA-binding Lrp family transcriptional regulator
MNEYHFLHSKDYTGRLEERMQTLQEAGVWTRIKRNLAPNFYKHYHAVIIVLQLSADKKEKLAELKFLEGN